MNYLASSALRIVLNENATELHKQSSQQVQNITDNLQDAIDYYVNIRICVFNMLDKKKNVKLDEFKLKHFDVIKELYDDIKTNGEIESSIWNAHSNFLDMLHDMRKIVNASKCKRCMCDMKPLLRRKPYSYYPFNYFAERESDDELYEMCDESLYENDDLDILFAYDTRETAIKKQYLRYEKKLIAWEKETEGHISCCASSRTFIKPPNYEDYYNDFCEAWFDKKEARK